MKNFMKMKKRILRESSTNVKMSERKTKESDLFTIPACHWEDQIF